MDPEKLFTDNMKLVHHIIKTHFPNLTLSGGGNEYEDYVQIGNIGLWKACVSFDKNKKIKFATYASKCIINEILMSLRKERNRVLNIAMSLEQEIQKSDGDDSSIRIIDMIESTTYEPYSISDFIIFIDDIIKIDTHRSISKDYYINGLSQRNISKKYSLSQPQISRILKKVKKEYIKEFERNGKII